MGAPQNATFLCVKVGHHSPQNELRQILLKLEGLPNHSNFEIRQTEFAAPLLRSQRAQSTPRARGKDQATPKRSFPALAIVFIFACYHRLIQSIAIERRQACIFCLCCVCFACVSLS